LGSGSAGDENRMEALALAQEARFSLGCSAAAKPHDFSVRIEGHADDESWTAARLLTPPRGVIA
jgi:hypothetical protein